MKSIWPTFLRTRPPSPTVPHRPPPSPTSPAAAHTCALTTDRRVCVDLGGNSNRTSCLAALVGLLDDSATPSASDGELDEDKAGAYRREKRAGMFIKLLTHVLSREKKTTLPFRLVVGEYARSILLRLVVTSVDFLLLLVSLTRV